MDNNQILNLLERLLYSKRGNFYYSCPVCDENFTKYGHRFDCDLAIAIKSLGGKEVKIQNKFGLLDKQ